MQCRELVIDGVRVGYVCGSRSRAKRCGCGRASARLCDYPLSGHKVGKTCDAPLCLHCATSVGANLDYCPPHARAAREDELVARKAEQARQEQREASVLGGERW